MELSSSSSAGDHIFFFLIGAIPLCYNDTVVFITI